MIATGNAKVWKFIFLYPRNISIIEFLGREYTYLECYLQDM